MSGTAARAPRLGVLLSGGGRTLQNLIDRTGDGRLRAQIAVVIADRPEALGLERARNAGLPAFCARDPAEIWRLLAAHATDLVILAGYLRLLPIAPGFERRVLNIHPALLPAFGGRGMHGQHVHAAVLAAGSSESGCTVHLCNDEYDRGPILLQQRVPVLPDDTVDRLAARVFAAECVAYPTAISEHWRALESG
ncbi:MAG TPA: phosphoribosylglycinamide formyltransferase [Planctomycetota bacterium]|nr:phosphoribosylglycinamide formyltransferase [Planctomycetota bacterium]